LSEATKLQAPAAVSEKVSEKVPDAVPLDLSAELPEVADWLPEVLLPAWELVAALPIAGAAAIAVVFYLAAFAFRGLVLNTIGRLAARTDTHLDNAVIGHLRRPVFNTILYFGLILATNVAQLPHGGPALINVFASVIVVSWMVATLRISNALLDNLSLDPRVAIVEARTIPMFDLVLKLTTLLVASYCLLMIWGINPLGWLASAGIVGIAVGFAAKDLLANFFGGLMIYMDRPFRTGDWIRSPDRNIEGTVESIGWRLTRIRTFDKRPLFVPNSIFASIAVENPQRMLNRRIYETIGIRYADLPQMHAITTDVKAMLTEHPEIDATQTLMVNFNAFGPSSVDFFVYTFTRTTNWQYFHQVKHQILLQISEIITGHGAEIAFPTTTLHVASLPPGQGSQTIGA
jgi:MscS family membrane protein